MLYSSFWAVIGKEWTPKDVERAIYSYVVNERGPTTTNKRKREATSLKDCLEFI